MGIGLGGLGGYGADLHRFLPARSLALPASFGYH